MAAEEEELQPRKPAGFQPVVLDSLSIVELRAYIGALEGEIARAEADIARKQGVRGAAEAVFRK